MSQSVGFVIPLLPGKTETERAALASMHSGERKADAKASRHRHGITRESAWIQSTPMGDLVVVYLEAEDLGAALGGIGTSTDPFQAMHAAHRPLREDAARQLSLFTDSSGLVDAASDRNFRFVEPRE